MAPTCPLILSLTSDGIFIPGLSTGTSFTRIIPAIICRFAFSRVSKKPRFYQKNIQSFFYFIHIFYSFICCKSKQICARNLFSLGKGSFPAALSAAGCSSPAPDSVRLPSVLSVVPDVSQKRHIGAFMF